MAGLPAARRSGCLTRALPTLPSSSTPVGKRAHLVLCHCVVLRGAVQAHHAERVARLFVALQRQLDVAAALEETRPPHEQLAVVGLRPHTHTHIGARAHTRQSPAAPHPQHVAAAFIPTRPKPSSRGGVPGRTHASARRQACTWPLAIPAAPAAHNMCPPRHHHLYAPPGPHLAVGRLPCPAHTHHRASSSTTTCNARTAPGC